MTATLDTASTVDMAQPYGPAPTPPGPTTRAQPGTRTPGSGGQPTTSGPDTDPYSGPMSGAVAVLIPVKAFGAAKGRLAEVLDGLARADLARRMAETVVTAAAPLPVTVVCDDDDVDAWARSQGAGWPGAATATTWRRPGFKRRRSFNSRFASPVPRPTSHNQRFLNGRWRGVPMLR